MFSIKRKIEDSRMNNKKNFDKKNASIILDKTRNWKSFALPMKGTAAIYLP